MTDLETLKRRIQLKQQAIILIKDEIRRDQIRLALKALKADLEAEMTEEFGFKLSRKLDAVNILLEE